MKKMIAAIGLVMATLLTGCGIGGSAPASSKPVTQVSGATTAEKALSIASIVSQKDAGLVAVTDAQLSGGLMALTDNGPMPIWYLLSADAKAANAALSKTRGLVFTADLMKANVLLSQQDKDKVQSAVADIFSLAANNFLQGNSKEFSFVEILVRYPPDSQYISNIPFSFLSEGVYYASSEDLSAERAKGAKADWQTFVEGDSTPANPGKQLALVPMLVPISQTQQQANPSSSASPSPAPGA